MVDYEKMYYKLFNSITDAIEILKKGQIATEQIFIDSDMENNEDSDKNSDKEV